MSMILSELNEEDAETTGFESYGESGYTAPIGAPVYDYDDIDLYDAPSMGGFHD